MKKVHFSLFILGALSFYGCTLEEPLKLGAKCSDGDNRITRIIQSQWVCTPDDLKGDKREDCIRYEDAFKYGYCPLDFFCIVDQDDQHVCSVNKCLPEEHEYLGGCEPNTLLNCGGHGINCEDVAGWVRGDCLSDHGGVCVAAGCERGYEINNESGLCEARLNCPDDAHIYDGECEPDDVYHCGKHGFSCAARVTGWLEGSCVHGSCVASACQAGYKPEDNSCVPTIECKATEHVYLTESSQCEADTVANCGHHGNACAALEGWVDGNCVDSRCFASACASGYVLREETGTCRPVTCEDGKEHLYQNACEPNSVEHCGRHDYNCEQRVPGWQSGLCIDGICEPSTCAAGYKSEAKSCVAVTICDENEHVSGVNLCSDDTVNACGSENNDCTRRAGWVDGACEAADCVASNCMEGYEVKDGQCVAKPAKKCTGCTSNEVCVDGKCVPTTCSQNCNTYQHATSGVCSLEGKCIATACEVGYHLYAGTCEVNSDANCGSHGNACTAVNQSVCQLERGVCECPEGFVLGELGCMKQPIEYICDASNYTDAIIDGEMIHAYCLSSLDKLMGMREGLIGHDTWPEDNHDRAFVLTEDIYLGNQAHWEALTFPEQGVLIGNHRTISGILSCDGDCALFNTFKYAKISDVNLNIDYVSKGNVASLVMNVSSTKLMNVKVKGNIQTTQSAAGIVYRMSESTIQNSSFEGSIYGGDEFSIGGIVNTMNGVMNNCYFNGVLEAGNIGGLLENGSDGTIINSHSYGKFTGLNIGGLVRDAGDRLDIISCSSSAQLIGNGDYVGGLIGNCIKSHIYSSAFYGTIHGENIIGGLIGDNGGGDPCRIHSSGVFGVIEGNGENTYIGGIFGNVFSDEGMYQRLFSSFIASDIVNAKSASQIGSSAFYLTEGYTTGSFRHVDNTSTDTIVDEINDEFDDGINANPNSKYYYWYDGATGSQMSSAEQIVYEGVSQRVGDKRLVDVLNEAYREFNSTEEDGWELRLCEITTGPANGTPTMYELAVPKTMVSIPICEHKSDPQ